VQTGRKRGWLSSMFFRSSGNDRAEGDDAGPNGDGGAQRSANLNDLAAGSSGELDGTLVGASDDDDDQASLSGFSAPGGDAAGTSVRPREGGGDSGAVAAGASGRLPADGKLKRCAPCCGRARCSF
jgi:hypothetical protein